MLLKNKHIFIVEDDPTNRAVILTILKQNGATVSFDHWGDTTLSNMKNMPQLDLILLDLMLPKQVSGYDVFDALRQLPEFQDVPVVAVTASDPDVEMNKARQKGLNGYISKPINRRKFPQQVKAVLNGEEVWGDEF